MCKYTKFQNELHPVDMRSFDERETRTRRPHDFTTPTTTKRGWRFVPRYHLAWVSVGTPVGPGKDTHGTLGPVRGEAVGGPNNLYDTASDERTTRSNRQDVVHERCGWRVERGSPVRCGQRDLLSAFASGTLAICYYEGASLDESCGR